MTRIFKITSLKSYIISKNPLLKAIFPILLISNLLAFRKIVCFAINILESQKGWQVSLSTPFNLIKLFTLRQFLLLILLVNLIVAFEDFHRRRLLVRPAAFGLIGAIHLLIIVFAKHVLICSERVLRVRLSAYLLVLILWVELHHIMFHLFEFCKQLGFQLNLIYLVNCRLCADLKC